MIILDIANISILRFIYDACNNKYEYVIVCNILYMKMNENNKTIIGSGFELIYISFNILSGLCYSLTLFK